MPVVDRIPDISHKAAIPGPLDGTAAKRGQKGGLIHLMEAVEFGGKRHTTGLKVRLGGWRRVYIIWADVEAIIAAKNPIAHLPCQFFRDRLIGFAKFNRKIGDAATGIHHIRLRDCRSGTRPDAERTGAT